MEVRIQKWGNSSGIRIPSNILKSLNLKINDKVELVQKEEQIIIKKIEKEKVSLEERFANYDGENLVKDFVWDEPKGKEIW